MAASQSEINQRVVDLHGPCRHGDIDRRTLLRAAAAVTAGGLAMAQAPMPRYAQAQTNAPKAEVPPIGVPPIFWSRRESYPSPGGNSGKMRGYLAWPSGGGTFPGVLVIHENDGLNEYIMEVANSLARRGFVALA